ncbi:MAG: HD-GYP domain-containing protein [Anaerolineae bacterium]
MKSLPVTARVYILLLLASCAALLGYALVHVSYSLTLVLEILIFAAMICIADLYPIVLPFEGNAEITVSCAMKTAVAIVFGPLVTVVITVLGTLIAEILLRRAWYKTAFNTSEMGITFATMSVIYEVLYDGTRMPFHSLQNSLAVILMMVAYFVVNTGLVTTIVCLATHTSFGHIWRSNFRDASWNNLTIIPVGAVMATLWQYRPWSVIALVLPIVVIRQSFEYIGAIQRQTREALITLADAIDQRDPSTYQHSQRVATIAEAVAAELEMPTEEVATIRMAARLHDLGKIGMSNTLLYKPGRFEPEEMETFRRHPVIGAQLVKSFRLFSEGQDLILHHHERYDGTGYPMGLQGDRIPIGGRVLAVADSLDAMTSRRVYRSSQTMAYALGELEANRGTQFDPTIVDAVLRVIHDWGDKLPWLVDRDDQEEQLP